MLLSECLRLFLVAQRAAGNSSRTVIWYRNQISAFLAAAGDIPIGSVRATMVRTFLADERERVSASTVAARWRALSAWFNWLVADEDIEIAVSPLAKVPCPSVPVHEPRRALLEDVTALVDSIPCSEDDWLGGRDQLAVRLLFWTGMRLAECAGLQVDDVEWRRREILVRHGKGGRDRRVSFPVALQPAIIEYLYRRPVSGGALFPAAWKSGRIRVDDAGAPVAITGSGLAQMIRRRCLAAGIRPLNPHSFRHGFAMSLLNDGKIPMGVLSKLLGHSDERITRTIYARWTDAAIHEAYDEAIERMGE